MEELYEAFSDFERGSDEFESFRNLYNEQTRIKIGSWLNKLFENPTMKDESEALHWKLKGNSLYSKKRFLESWKCYTKSLCFTLRDSELFGVGIANRSAVLFMMHEFKPCLNDIAVCLSSHCPEDVMIKVYIRQIKCYFSLNDSVLVKKSCDEALNFIQSHESLAHKETYILEINGLKNQQITENPQEQDVENVQLPELKDGANSNFLYASSAIRIGYDDQKGRHVLASESINVGDVLFVEKAFVFAPVFVADAVEFQLDVCYNCLKRTLNGIPCGSCTLALYCNDSCRESSWNEFHKWECVGMHSRLWYDIGIAFPAWRTVVKGLKSGWFESADSRESDVDHYGDIDDNYMYFNKLESNISRMAILQPYVVSAAVIVAYLKLYTDFFETLLLHPSLALEGVEDIMCHVGGLLIRHMAQLICNSSIIKEWKKDLTEAPIACGIYPSVSMMNHSCKTKITMFYLGDTVIVKATDSFTENEEIFNCYGVNYLHTTREERQKILKESYFFECSCEVCASPNQSFDIKLRDSYLCPKCKRGLIPDTNDTRSTCLLCRYKINMNNVKTMHLQAQTILRYATRTSTVETMISCYANAKKLFCGSHMFLTKILQAIQDLYETSGDWLNLLLWVKKEWKLRAKTVGRYHFSVGTFLYYRLKYIWSTLEDKQFSNVTQFKDVVERLWEILREAKKILSLYWPPHLIKFDQIETELQVFVLNFVTC